MSVPFGHMKLFCSPELLIPVVDCCGWQRLCRVWGGTCSQPCYPRSTRLKMAGTFCKHRMHSTTELCLSFAEQVTFLTGHPHLSQIDTNGFWVSERKLDYDLEENDPLAGWEGGGQPGCTAGCNLQIRGDSWFTVYRQKCVYMWVCVAFLWSSNIFIGEFWFCCSPQSLALGSVFREKP